MPGKPWQNGSNESFNGTFRRECLDAESFRQVMEAQVVMESWRRQYNQERPHSTLGYQTPASVYWGERKGPIQVRRPFRTRAEKFDAHL